MGNSPSLEQCRCWRKLSYHIVGGDSSPENLARLVSSFATIPPPSLVPTTSDPFKLEMWTFPVSFSAFDKENGAYTSVAETTQVSLRSLHFSTAQSDDESCEAEEGSSFRLDLGFCKGTSSRGRCCGEGLISRERSERMSKCVRSEMEGTLMANALDDEDDADSDIVCTGIKENVSVWKSSCGGRRAYD